MFRVVVGSRHCLLDHKRRRGVQVHDPLHFVDMDIDHRSWNHLVLLQTTLPLRREGTIRSLLIFNILS